MKYRILMILILCSMTAIGQKQLELKIQHITHQDSMTQVAPYLTLDELNRPAICWTTQKPNQKNYFLSYAKWDTAKNLFSEPKIIPTSLGMQNHKESMGKIAFQANGVMVAVYGVKRPTPQNRYAGYIATSKSLDGGINWSKKEKLVKDTSSQSQRFFDIERLINGSIGMSWLDNRKMEPNKDGSTLYFGMSNEYGDFITEKAIAGSTCQCCRTDILMGKDSTIHIAFRDIIQDTIRDMMHLYSNDLGDTFSSVSRISVDNWIINGCPHTGPSIAQNNNGLGYAWFTGGGKTGVYFAKAIDFEHNLDRVLVSEKLKHPQMIGLNNNQYLLVGDEVDHIGDIYFGRISLYLINSNGTFKQYFITKKDSDNSHPVIIKINDKKVVIAWTKYLSDSKKVNYAVLDIDNLK